MISSPRRMSFIFLNLSLLVALFLTGCSVSPLLNPLPEDLELTSIATVDNESPAAIDPAGEYVAYVRKGLYVHETVTDRRVRLSDDAPTTLAWNSKGTTLYATFSDGKRSRLVLFDHDGRRVAETLLDGRVTTLACVPSGEALALAVVLKAYSFGGAYQVILYRWDGENQATQAAVGDTSVKPRTLELFGDKIYKTARMALSPLGDEVVITRLYDPPAFPPSLRSYVYHLETGVQTEPFEIPHRGVLQFLPDGEQLLFSDGLSQLLRVDPKNLSTEPYLASAGEGLVVSPSGRYIFSGGVLYADRVEKGSFSPDSVAHFSTTGTMLLQSGRSLWLLRGLNESAPLSTLTDEERKTLLRGREWRSKGLITEDEYQMLRRNLEKP